MPEDNAVVDIEDEDDDDGSMMCNKHQYKNNPGGICAVCLQEKLGHLVSSSLPNAAFCSSKSSASLRSQSVSNKKSAFLQRSKSTAATPFRDDQIQNQRRSFWSFLFYSKNAGSSANGVGVLSSRSSSVRQGIIAEDDSPAPISHTDTASSNKVSRSRSVGCTGGGIFGGFNISSSSTSFSSSSHWVPPTITASEEAQGTGRMNGVAVGQMGHGRSRSWAWALSSPWRVFTKPNSSSDISTKNTAVSCPSLLSVNS